MRSFHPLISSASTFIFIQFLTFCKCKPMYFRLLLLMIQYFRFKHRGKVLSERRVLPQYCLALNHLENKSVKWRNELMLNTVERESLVGGKFGEFGESWMIRQTKTIQLSTYN